MTTPEAQAAAEELQPCPFCGGPGKPNWEGREGKRRHWVYCEHCCAQTNGHRVDGHYYSATSQIEAAVIWNARPHFAAQAGEIAELTAKLAAMEWEIERLKAERDTPRANVNNPDDCF